MVVELKFYNDKYLSTEIILTWLIPWSISAFFVSSDPYQLFPHFSFSLFTLLLVFFFLYSCQIILSLFCFFFYDLVPFHDLTSYICLMVKQSPINLAVLTERGYLKQNCKGLKLFKLKFCKYENHHFYKMTQELQYIVIIF